MTAASRPPSRSGKPARAWQRMLSGRRLDLLDPTALDIEIDDIAHGLAFVARWNGQTSGDWPYSVAEHSLLVEAIFSRNQPDTLAGWRLAALLHDAPEYVIGDMISPVKAALGDGYSRLDARLTEAVHRRFGLPAVIPQKIRTAIKVADRVSARLEAESIAGFNKAEAARLFPLPRNGGGLHGLEILLRPPVQVRTAFLARFNQLIADYDEQGGLAALR